MNKSRFMKTGSIWNILIVRPDLVEVDKERYSANHLINQ